MQCSSQRRISSQLQVKNVHCPQSKFSRLLFFQNCGIDIIDEKNFFSLLIHICHNKRADILSDERDTMSQWTPVNHTVYCIALFPLLGTFMNINIISQ